MLSRCLLLGSPSGFGAGASTPPSPGDLSWQKESARTAAPLPSCPGAPHRDRRSSSLIGGLSLLGFCREFFARADHVCAHPESQLASRKNCCAGHRRPAAFNRPLRIMCLSSMPARVAATCCHVLGVRRAFAGSASVRDCMRRRDAAVPAARSVGADRPSAMLAPCCPLTHQ